MSLLHQRALPLLLASFTFIAAVGLAAGPARPAAVKPTLALPSPTPKPSASATPALGADLATATAFGLASTASQCGNAFATQSEIAKCPAAIAAHQLVFTWDYQASNCRKGPCTAADGFNLVRQTGNGESGIFATAAGSDRGVILQVHGDEMIGACFYVLPFHGTTDFGARSNTTCIDETEHARLTPTRYATAHNSSYDDGSGCKSPSSNPVGYGFVYGPLSKQNALIAGYVTRSGGKSIGGDIAALVNVPDAIADLAIIGDTVSNSGSSHTCNHYRDVFQGLIYYDLSKFVGKKITKATLDIDVISGGWNAGSTAGDDGNEHGNAAPNCVASIGFPTNVNMVTDVSIPARILFDPAAKPSGAVGHLTADVTGMVHAWLQPGGINRGMVLSPAYLNPASPPTYKNATVYNADCVSHFGEPYLTIDATL